MGVGNDLYAVSAVLMLKDLLTPGLRSASREVGNLKSSVGGMRGAMQGFAANMDSARRATALATSEIATFIKMADAGAAAARRKMDMEFAIKVNGESPDVAAAKMGNLNKLIIDATRATGGNRNVLYQATIRKAGYLGKEFMDAGGVKAGAQMDEAAHAVPGEGGGVKLLASMMTGYQIKKTPENINATAEMLSRYFRKSGMESQEEFGSQLSRESLKVLKAYGLTEKSSDKEKADAARNAAALLAATATIKPNRAGFSVATLYEELAKPNKHRGGGGGATGKVFYDAAGMPTGPQMSSGGGGAGPALWDKKGKLKPLEDWGDAFADFAKKNKDAAKRAEILEKTLGASGSDMAEVLSAVNIREFLKAADEQETLKERSKWLGDEMEVLRANIASSAKAIEENLGGPATEWMKKGMEKVGPKFESLEKFTKENKTAQNIASGLSIAGLVAAVGYGVTKLGKGGIKGFLGGKAGTAAGVAEGALWGKAAGVQSVFVVNMPGGGIGGGGSGPVGRQMASGTRNVFEDVAAGVGAGGAGRLAAWAATPVLAAGAGGIGAAVGAGLAIAGVVGTAINQASGHFGDKKAAGDISYERTWMGLLAGEKKDAGLHGLTVIEAAMAHVGAFFGSGSMKDLLAERESLQKGGTTEQAVAAAKMQNEAAEAMLRASQKFSGELHVVIEDEKGTRIPSRLGKRE